MREKTGKQINVPLDKIIIITTSKPKKRIEDRERERELRSDKKRAKKREISTTNFLYLKRGGTVEYAVESAREIIRRRSRSNR